LADWRDGSMAAYWVVTKEMSMVETMVEKLAARLALW
jgi:hypothetical protein